MKTKAKKEWFFHHSPIQGGHENIKMVKKQIVSLLLAAVMTFAVLPATVRADSQPDLTVAGGTLDTDYTYQGNDLIFQRPGTYAVSMAEGVARTAALRIVVRNPDKSNDTFNITLDGVNIDKVNNNLCAFEIQQPSVVNLTLAGNNYLTSAGNNAGIRCSTGSTLTIGGSGYLEANGGTSNMLGGGAGIGENSYHGQAIGAVSGTINIIGGTIDAKGGGGAAGIGGGSATNCGVVNISGGTVTATGGDGSSHGAGIGAGLNFFGDNKFDGHNGNGGIVTISGGIVTARGVNHAAGIGGAYVNSNIDGAKGGTLTITGGFVEATAGSSEVAAIGGGHGGSGKGGDGANVHISGGTVILHGWIGAGLSTGTAGDPGTCVITGGSLKTDLNGMKPIPKNVTENVYLTTVMLENVSAVTAVNSLTASLNSVPYTYGISDMYTDKQGKLYLYLPATTSTTAAQTSNGATPPRLTTYIGSIETTDNHLAEGVLYTTQLTAPTGLAWDGSTPGKSTWGSVAHASSYTIQLFKGSTAQGSAVSGITATEYDFTAVIVSAGSGDYTFKVIAIGDGTNYTDSDQSAASAAYTYTAPPTLYPATVTVNKDGTPWSSGAPVITIGLDSGSAVANGSNLANGTYNIYADCADTGVDITVIDSAASATLDYYSLIVNAGTGITSVNGAGVYLSGASANIDAVVSDGYNWEKWSDGNTSKARTLTINSTLTLTANATLTYSGGGGGGSSSSSTPATPTHKASVSGASISTPPLPVSVNTNAGSATVDLGTTLAKDIFAGSGTTVLTVPSIPGVNSYTLGIPADFLSGSQGEGAITFSTGAGSITIPSNMLTGVSGISGSQAEITIGQGDKDNLPDDVKSAIGNKPLIQLTLSIDGKQTDWNNPDAPVTVSIPYTPTAEELANPENIVIWYIDGSGRAVSVPNGRYDPATGTVTFTTTHFSYYAVSYKQVSFKDVAKDSWYARAVSFIAARGITTGTGGGNFSPEANLTRGQFIVMLMKAYGITPDANPKNNFADAGNTWYTGYVAAAKRLGISAGVGSNLFAPEKEITRQEMFTLLYNTLKVSRQLPRGDSGKTLSDFTDAGQINAWAKEAMMLLVKTGTVGGSNEKLTPQGTTTRAEMTQVLYNLLRK